MERVGEGSPVRTGHGVDDEGARIEIEDATGRGSHELQRHFGVQHTCLEVDGRRPVEGPRPGLRIVGIGVGIEASHGSHGATKQPRMRVRTRRYVGLAGTHRPVFS